MLAAGIGETDRLWAPYNLAVKGDLEFLTAYLKHVEPNTWLLTGAAIHAPGDCFRAILDAFDAEVSDDNIREMERGLTVNLAKAAARWKGAHSVGKAIRQIQPSEIRQTARAVERLMERFPSAFADPDRSGQAIEILSRAKSSLPSKGPRSWIEAGIRESDDVIHEVIAAIRKRAAIRKVISAGWTIRHLDDGYGEPGHYAFTGPTDDPRLETGIFSTPEEAAVAAMTTWPDEFETASDVAMAPLKT